MLRFGIKPHQKVPKGKPSERAGRKATAYRYERKGKPGAIPGRRAASLLQTVGLSWCT